MSARIKKRKKRKTPKQRVDALASEFCPHHMASPSGGYFYVKGACPICLEEAFVECERELKEELGAKGKKKQRCILSKPKTKSGIKRHRVC